MTSASTTRQSRNVSKRSDGRQRPELLTSDKKHNKSGSDDAVEVLQPKSSEPSFDAKRLETFSLGDFVELLEAAGMMPTGSEKVVGAEEIATKPVEMDWACIGRLRESRFRFLVEHFYSGDGPIY